MSSAVYLILQLNRVKMEAWLRNYHPRFLSSSRNKAQRAERSAGSGLSKPCPPSNARSAPARRCPHARPSGSGSRSAECGPCRCRGVVAYNDLRSAFPKKGSPMSISNVTCPACGNEHEIEIVEVAAGNRMDESYQCPWDDCAEKFTVHTSAVQLDPRKVGVDHREE